MAKTSKTNNKIYLNKYKCLVSQRNFVHSFVCLCMKRESHTHTLPDTTWWEVTWCVFVCAGERVRKRQSWSRSSKWSNVQREQKDRNEANQPISPNLNSICPFLLRNDTNSAVLMECNYFNPIKCRLSFWSGAVAFETKIPNHGFDEEMANEDAYTESGPGMMLTQMRKRDGTCKDQIEMDREWKKPYAYTPIQNDLIRFRAWCDPQLNPFKNETNFWMKCEAWNNCISPCNQFKLTE